ncbi:MAG TPA: hypothetical protein DCS19_05440 [Flavobacterium sp.]|jgi:preprotein translocase subunit SecG|nr:hypothetical protein [Flavobacterium sp.]
MPIKTEEKALKTQTVAQGTEAVENDSDGGTNLLTAIAIILAIVFLVLAILFFLKNRKLNDDLSTEKEKVETVTQRYNQLQNQVTALSGSNVNLDDSLVSAQREMAEKVVLIERLTVENTNLKKIKDQLLQMENIRNSTNDQLKKLYESLRKSIDSTEANNRNLQQRLR